MSIWKKNTSISYINEEMLSSIDKYIGLCYKEINSNGLKASFTLNNSCMQPFGILHGGVSALVSESVASVASNLALEEGNYPVGINLHTEHISSVKEGVINILAIKKHLGKTTHLWQVELYSKERLISISKLRLMVIKG